MSTLLFDILVAVVFLTMVSVLVAAHEYGHYLFARLFGMGIEEFAIGMAKRVKVWKRVQYDLPVLESYVHDPKALSSGYAIEGGTIVRPDSEIVETPNGRVLRETTDFTIRLLPIGGFVRIKGMVPEEDGSEVKIPGGFYSKPPLQRLVVLFGGPLFSVIAGLIVLTGVYSTAGADVPDLRPVIGGVVEANKTTPEPAWDAGLRAGDEIVAVDGTPIASFYQFVRIVNTHANVPLSVVYRHQGTTRTTKLTPALGEAGVYDATMEQPMDTKVQGRIGVMNSFKHVVLPIPAAFSRAVRVPLLEVEGLFQIVLKPSRFRQEAGSAVTMVRITSDAVREGAAKTIEWTGLLSIILGVCNLLPFPPLDGGQMIVAFAELLRGGRRLSIKVQGAVVSAGLVTVALLVAFALFVDVQRWSDSSGPALDRTPPAQQKK